MTYYKQLAISLARGLDLECQLQHMGRADLFEDPAEALSEDDMEGYTHPDNKEGWSR